MFSRILQNSPPPRRKLSSLRTLIFSWCVSALVSILIIYLVVTYGKSEPVCPEPASIEMKADQEKTDVFRKL